MENSKYKVSRDNIYVGEIVKVNRIYRCASMNASSKANSEKLAVGSWKAYRSILFVPSEEKFSDDLLYKTPNYPILNITSDEKCFDFEKESIVVKDACNLAKLLEYFGYPKELTFEDIMKIRNTFFTGRFAKDNCELFGRKEITQRYWMCNQDETSMMASKEMKGIERGRRMRIFASILDHVLPREYFDILDSRAIHSIDDVMIEFDEKLDAFVPHREEGPVKRLKK